TNVHIGGPRASPSASGAASTCGVFLPSHSHTCPHLITTPPSNQRLYPYLPVCQTNPDRCPIPRTQSAWASLPRLQQANAQPLGGTSTEGRLLPSGGGAS